MVVNSDGCGAHGTQGGRKGWVMCEVITKELTVFDIKAFQVEPRSHNCDFLSYAQERLTSWFHFYKSIDFYFFFISIHGTQFNVQRYSK